MPRSRNRHDHFTPKQRKLAAKRRQFSRFLYRIYVSLVAGQLTRQQYELLKQRGYGQMAMTLGTRELPKYEAVDWNAEDAAVQRA